MSNFYKKCGLNFGKVENILLFRVRVSATVFGIQEDSFSVSSVEIRDVNSLIVPDFPIGGFFSSLELLKV